MITNEITAFMKKPKEFSVFSKNSDAGFGSWAVSQAVKVVTTLRRRHR